MDRKKLIYIGSLLIVTVIISITYFSYAFFTNKSEQHGKINVVAGTLNYDVKGEGISNKSITIQANTTKKIELTLKSLNEINSKYELYYTTTSNDIEVGYSSDTEDDISGTIVANGKKKITVFVTNPTSSSITVTFNAEGGFSGNNLTRTLGKAIPSQESICENYETHVFNFGYTANTQEFAAPCDGTYVVETWGSEGGVSSWGGVAGYGGYAIGNIELTESSNLYLNIGSKSGYNGGYTNSTGGGATSITTTDRGELYNFENYKDEVLMVSGGGGGAERELAGSGGGYIGGTATPYQNAYQNFGTGGTQTTGGIGKRNNNDTATLIGNLDGTFGKGGCGLSNGDSGPSGGGGWYGGGATTVAGGAGGGSGYIGSPNLTNKAMYCYDCEETTEVDTYTISTTTSAYMENSSSCPDGYSSNPISKCAKAGNGYARITYYGKDTTKVTYDYNYLPNDIFSEYYNTSSLIVANASIGVTANSYTDEYGLGYETTRYCETCANSSGIYLRRIKSLSVGKKYTLIIEAKADGNYDFLLEHEQLNHPYDYSRTLSTNWQRYKITAEVNKDSGTIILYRWVSSTNRTLYIRNIQIQEGDLYTTSRNYESGSTLSDIETPKRNGCTFVGWFTDPIGGTQVTSSTIVPNSDTTYYAHWTYITE